MTETNDPSTILKDKGKLPLVETNSVSIADIKLTLLNQTIEARVYRKWLAKNVVTQVASNFCVILLDKQGNAIQANMDVKDKDYFNDLLQLNDAYRISRFSDPLRSGDATRTRRIRRIIDVQNLDGMNLPFLIWGDKAENFDMDEYNQMQKPVIIAIASAWATKKYGENFDMDEYNQMQKPVIIAIASAWATKKYGGLQLSSTSATHYYLNPNIPEATYILDTYANFITPTPALEIQRQSYNNPLLEQTRNRYNINTLLGINPQHYEQIRFTTEATLIQITAPNGWYYRKCNTCNIKVSDNSDLALCHNHGPQPIPNYGYCFRAIIDDGTATTTVTCFSPEAHTFVPDCNTIVNTMQDKDTSHVPAELKHTEGHTYIFQYHFGQKSKLGYPNFKLDAVLQPVAEPLLALPAAETIKSPATQVLDEASISNNPTTTNKDQPEAGKLPAQTSAEILEDQAKKTRRSLFQETDTTAKKPRRNA
ncbi:DNA helicase [Tanacetum coccineum]